jgi:hypothetical protein
VLNGDHGSAGDADALRDIRVRESVGSVEDDSSTTNGTLFRRAFRHEVH